LTRRLGVGRKKKKRRYSPCRSLDIKTKRSYERKRGMGLTLPGKRRGEQSRLPTERSGSIQRTSRVKGRCAACLQRRSCQSIVVNIKRGLPSGLKWNGTQEKGKKRLVESAVYCPFRKKKGATVERLYQDKQAHPNPG